MGPAFDHAQALYDAAEPPDLMDDDDELVAGLPAAPEPLVIASGVVHWTRAH